MSTSARIQEALAPVLSEYSRPIDLSGGRIHAIGHLANPAVLQLGEDVVVIHPYPTDVAISDQEYRLVSPSALLHQMDRADDGDETELLSSLRPLVYPSRHPADSVQGVELLLVGEQAYLGRQTTPQLQLGESVNDEHGSVRVTQTGVTIVDLSIDNTTVLYLSNADASNTPELTRTPPVRPRVRQEVQRNLRSALLTGGLIEYISEELIVEGGPEAVEAGRFEAIRLGVSRATDLDELHPGLGYITTIVEVVPELQEITITKIPDKSERVRGIVKASTRTPASPEQARQVLQLSRQVSAPTELAA